MASNLPTGYPDPGDDNLDTGTCTWCKEEVDLDELVDDYGDIICQECLGMKYE